LFVCSPIQTDPVQPDYQYTTTMKSNILAGYQLIAGVI